MLGIISLVTPLAKAIVIMVSLSGSNSVEYRWQCVSVNCNCDVSINIMTLMSSKKQKYYVVWHGHKPGIYSTWEQCLAQVKNFPNAIYKSFTSFDEAKEAFHHGQET